MTVVEVSVNILITVESSRSPPFHDNFLIFLKMFKLNVRINFMHCQNFYVDNIFISDFLSLSIV